jgi:hypothetical protein
VKDQEEQIEEQDARIRKLNMFEIDLHRLEDTLEARD